MNRLSLLFIVFIFVGLTSVLAQNTVKKQRIASIAHDSYRGDTVYRTDSLQFFYTGNNGSYFDPYTYSSPGNPYGSGYNILYSVRDILIPRIPSLVADAKVNVKFDSVRLYVKTLSNYNFYDYHITKYSDTNIILAERWMTLGTLHRIIIQRNSKGVAETIYFLGKLFQQSLDTTFVNRLFYDDQNRLVTDSSIAGLNPTLTRYRYDGSGNLTDEIRHAKQASDWKEIEHIYYYYRSDGAILGKIFVAFNTGKPYPDTINSRIIEYDPYNRVTRVKNYLYGILIQTFDYHYNAAGNVDSIKNNNHSVSTGDYLGTYSTVLYYNSYNNPDSAVSRYYPDPDNTYPSGFHTRFYYELYEDIPPASPEAPLIIYPNPAKHRFKIRWNSKLPPVPVYVILYANNGQRVKSTYIAKAKAEDVIELGGLSSGVYYVSIITSSGGLIHSQGIIVNQ